METLFYTTFTDEYNISSYTPRKDQCDNYAAFYNTDERVKADLKDNHDRHLRENELARSEKAKDNSSVDSLVAVYDLQAVTQLPKRRYKCALL